MPNRLWQRLRSEFLTHDPSQLAWRAGSRAALAVAGPLAVASLVGRPADGVVAAVGALVSGFAGLSGSFPRRLRTTAWAAVWVATAAGVGTATGGWVWLSVLLVAVSGALAGLLGAVSPEFAQVATLATNAQVVFAGLHLGAAQAPQVAALVLAGGASQWVWLWILGRWEPTGDGSNRLRESLAALAAYCRRPGRDQDLAVARALAVAEERVADPAIPADRRRRLQAWLAALDAARNDVVALHIARPEAAAPALRTTAAALEGLRLFLEASPARRRQAAGLVEGALAALAAEGERWPAGLVRDRLLHLKGQLDAMRAVAAGTQPSALEWEGMALPSSSWRERVWMPLRTALHFSSPTFRHALRVAAALAGAEALYRLTGLARGYWVALTVMVVLKPDFFSTVVRGIGRALGTALGVVVGSVVAAGVGDAHSASGVAVVAVDAAALYSVLNYNYGLFSLLVSAEIVLLLALFERVAPALAMRERLLATLLGSGLALAAYVLMPTWQRQQVPGELARLLRAEADYLGAILAGSGVAAARRRTRLTRVRVAAVVASAVSEPAPLRLDARRVIRLLDLMHRLAAELMALEFTAERPPYRRHPGFLAFAEGLRQRLQEIATVLEGADRHPHRLVAPGPTPDAEGVRDPALRGVARRLASLAEEMAAQLPLAAAR